MAFFATGGTSTEMTTVDLPGSQARLSCAATAPPTAVPTISKTPCLTRLQCRSQATQLGLSFTVQDGFLTKGCLERAGQAIWSPGTVEDMSKASLPGLQQRIWCDGMLIQNQLIPAPTREATVRPTKQPTTAPTTAPTQRPTKRAKATKQPTSQQMSQPPSGMPTASLLPTQTSLVVVLPWRPGVDAAVEHKEYRDTEAPTVTSAPTATTITYEPTGLLSSRVPTAQPTKSDSWFPKIAAGGTSVAAAQGVSGAVHVGVGTITTTAAIAAILIL